MKPVAGSEQIYVGAENVNNSAGMGDVGCGVGRDRLRWPL